MSYYFSSLDCALFKDVFVVVIIITAVVLFLLCCVLTLIIIFICFKRYKAKTSLMNIQTFATEMIRFYANLNCQERCDPAVKREINKLMKQFLDMQIDTLSSHNPVVADSRPCDQTTDDTIISHPVLMIFLRDNLPETYKGLQTISGDQ